MKTLGLLLMGLLLSACTDIAFWLANRPVELNGVKVYHDVAYGEAERLKLDVYRPTDAKNAPVLLYFYGGGWGAGQKDQYRFVAEVLTGWGYVVVIPDYRLYPEVTFPAFIQDTAAAMAWAHRYIGDYGGDPQRLFAMGHSAGAYNAAMALTDASYLQAEGLSPAIIQKFVGLAGPYNFTPTDKKYQRIFNQMNDYTRMHVGTYANGDEPPMLLLHGRDDGTVSIRNAETLASQLNDAGGHAKTHFYFDIGHYGIVGIFTKYWQNDTGIKEDILAFILHKE